MALTPGSRLGVYEVTEQIGAGGMGEVYRATDSNLKRSVAIKVLPASVAGDPDRLARFQREAEVLAALNHPNIAAIYGLEKTPDAIALVMELVEGDDLSQRIARGAIPMDEALPIAKQIADALEAAHDQGIIHRDLKPANIKVRTDGTVKVLDFGLAKAMDPADPSTAEAMHSPTLTMRATQMGVILGTAAYMAPEQARGRSVDRRADIWAFGCVLYEMLTGRRLFAGEDMTETLASVVKEQPDLTHVPPNVQRLLRRCLERDPRQRLKNIGDAWALLDPDSKIAAAPATARAVPWIPWTTTALSLVAAAGLALWHFTSVAPVGPATRFHVEWPGITLAGDAGGAKFFQLSPDGRALAIVSQNSLWVRTLDAIDPVRIEHTEGATYPFWSPDSERIAFFAGGELKKVSRGGGPVQTICEAPDGRGGAWSENGTIIFSSTLGARGLSRVSEAGGAPARLTTVTTKGANDAHRYPQFLPDGEHFIYLHLTGDSQVNGVYAGALDGTPAVRVLDGPDSALYMPATNGDTGYLLFRRQDTLMAQPFELKPFRTSGAMFPVAEKVAEGANTRFGAFAVSNTGTIAYSSEASTLSELIWMDRSGTRLGSLGPASDSSFSLSRDGRHLAQTQVGGLLRDVWIRLLPDGTASKLTFGPSPGWMFPAWSPDARYVAFATIDNAGLASYEIRRRTSNMTGAEETLLRSDAVIYLWEWSRDGKSLVYTRGSGTGADIWLLPLDAPRTPVQLTNSPMEDQFGQISPDGQWLAYASGDRGQMQVYVKPVAPSPALWLVSKDGGTMPRWSETGQELFYRASNGELMAVPITTGGSGPAAEFQHGAPHALFGPVPSPGNVVRFTYQPTPDGQKFLVAVPAAGSAPPITVVLNWQASIRK